jgi:glycosyltransferase involved in cell wall biosynthesis
MTVALVTNYLPPYRVPLYRLLAERFDVNVFCFGGEAHYVPDALRDLDRQLAEAPFPVHRLSRQRDAAALATRHRSVIAALAGRVAVPAAYLGARRAGRSFLLWTSLWRHPRTPAHAVSFPVMRRLYRDADAILTYGPHVSSYVRRYRGRGQGVLVAPQAVEPELFGRHVDDEEIGRWRAAAGLPPGPLALFVGRLVEEKGVDLLLRAWERLAPEAGAVLCLVGDGRLGARVSARRADRIHLLGRLAREDLPVAYAAAAFVVVPSLATRRFLEPWGLVCNEAMMQGRPVIATDAVGAAVGGLVRDGETGLVVPAEESALAAAIGRLVEDPALRERLGSRARAVVEDYSYERAANAFGQALAYARALRS